MTILIPKKIPEAPDLALASAANKNHFALSIRAKGLIAFAALIAYSVAITLFAFYQKNLLLRDFEEIQGTFETEAMLKQEDVAAFHTVMALFTRIVASDRAQENRFIPLESLQPRPLTGSTAQLPNVSSNMANLNAAWNAANKNPSKANLNRVIVELIKAKNNRALLTEQVQARRKFLSENYRRQSNSVAMATFLLGMLGLGLLGTIIGLFFRRLADDVRMLQSRALKIVRGFRGEPVAITRYDEVGQLMVAVNNMADTLDQREKELLLERQKYFHQEKMAAIGALAAGIAHEIGNPIAAISGIAQDMMERRAANKGACSEGICYDCRPELIYAQTQRLATITHEISELASPRAAEAQFLDLNEQLRSTSSLIRYDKRLQHVTLQLELDSQLPAIYGAADQLTQLIMNLLINSMDALDGMQDRTPTIVIATMRAGTEHARLLIEDNGCGIESETLGRVFEPFFTTKPAGKGTGLGLSLCYSIIKKHGGTIEIDSTPGAGTKVQVFFPLDDTSYDEVKSL